jgi:hypothetical protein
MATRVLLTGIPSYVNRFGQRTDGLRSALRGQLPRPRCKPELVAETKAIGNTGNYVIGDGALGAFPRAEVTYVPFWRLRAQIDKTEFREGIGEQFDFFVLVTANLLRSDYSAESEAHVLSLIDLPVVVMGIGLQRKKDLDSGLPAGTLQFLEQIKRREHCVLTRGTETAEYLKARGLRSVVPTGCPSLFFAPDNVVKALARLKEYEFCGGQRIAYHGYIGKGKTSVSVGDMNRFRCDGGDRAFVLQDEFLHYGLELNCADDERAYDDASGEIICATGYDGQAELAGEKLPLHIFFNTDQWRAWMSSFDFCFGRRFHGSVVAMQAGIPALPIAVDDRMREMLSYSGIPSIDVEQWRVDRPAETVIGDAIRTYDLAQSVDRYSANAGRFRSELAALGF